MPRALLSELALLATLETSTRLGSTRRRGRPTAGSSGGAPIGRSGEKERAGGTAGAATEPPGVPPGLRGAGGEPPGRRPRRGCGATPGGATPAEDHRVERYSCWGDASGELIVPAAASGKDMTRGGEDERPGAAGPWPRKAALDSLVGPAKDSGTGIGSGLVARMLLLSCGCGAGKEWLPPEPR